MKLFEKISCKESFDFKILNIPFIQLYKAKRNGTKEVKFSILPSKTISEKLFEKITQYDNNKPDVIFCSSPGLGDNFFLALYLKEFKKKINLKIGVLLREDRCLELHKALSYADNFYTDREIFNDVFGYEGSSLKINKKDCKKTTFPYLKNSDSIDFYGEHYACLLGLNPKTPFEKPNISENFLNIAKDEFEKLGIAPQNSIVLSPFARYFDYSILPVSFWTNLADVLIDKGYDVIFNTTQKDYKNYVCIYPKEIMVLLAMISMSKNFISFRSGINDVACGFGLSNQIILYPSNFKLCSENCFNKFRAFHNEIAKNKTPEQKIEFLKRFYSTNEYFKVDCQEFYINESPDANYQNDVEKIIKEMEIC